MTLAAAPRTGIDLKIERMRRRVPAKTLARTMGVARSRVSNIEALDKPTDVAIRRYMAALDRLEPRP